MDYKKKLEELFGDEIKGYELLITVMPIGYLVENSPSYQDITKGLLVGSNLISRVQAEAQWKNENTIIKDVPETVYNVKDVFVVYKKI